MPPKSIKREGSPHTSSFVIIIFHLDPFSSIGHHLTFGLSILPTHTHTDSSRVPRVASYTGHCHFERLWALSDSLELVVEQFGPSFSPPNTREVLLFYEGIVFDSFPPPVTHSSLPFAKILGGCLQAPLRTPSARRFPARNKCALGTRHQALPHRRCVVVDSHVEEPRKSSTSSEWS